MSTAWGLRPNIQGTAMENLSCALTERKTYLTRKPRKHFTPSFAEMVPF